MLALAELLDAERTLATIEQPVLVERTDAGRMWLLWFAIGATDEVCQLTGRRTERERNQVFRRVVALIFGDGVRSEINPDPGRPAVHRPVRDGGRPRRAGVPQW